MADREVFTHQVSFEPFEVMAERRALEHARARVAVIVVPLYRPDAEPFESFVARAEIARRIQVDSHSEEYEQRSFAAFLVAASSTNRYQAFLNGELTSDEYYRSKPAPTIEFLQAWDALTAKAAS